MREAAQMLGLFAAVLLLIAVGTWVKLSNGPALQRLDGKAARNGNVEIASQLLVVAVLLSAVAASLAVAGWIRGG